MVADLRAERAAAPSAEEAEALAGRGRAPPARGGRPARRGRRCCAPATPATTCRRGSPRSRATPAPEARRPPRRRSPSAPRRARAEAARADATPRSPSATRPGPRSRPRAPRRERVAADRGRGATRPRAGPPASRGDGGRLRATSSPACGSRTASLRAAHEQLEDELEELRGVREERDALAGELERVRAEAADDERARADLGGVIRELQDRAAEADAERAAADGRSSSEARERIAARLEQDATPTRAERRIDAERATTTEVHARLATAREEATRTIAAEAEETERLRARADETARRTPSALLAAERAEVARLREELIARAEAADGGGGEASRRMVERIDARPRSRADDHARAAARARRAALADARAHRRDASTATRQRDARARRAAATAPSRTPEGTQRRVDAARAASARPRPAKCRSRRRPVGRAARRRRCSSSRSASCSSSCSRRSRERAAALPGRRRRPLPSRRCAARRWPSRSCSRALALAALSLLRPWALAFDPMAWLVWGRDTLAPRARHEPRAVVEAAAGASSPRRSRSSRGAAPALWLIVARAGGLLGAGRRVRAGARSWRAAGRASRRRRRWCCRRGGCSTLRSATPRACWPRRSCGPSSRTSTAGRARRSCCGTAAALLRPEVWPFLGRLRALAVARATRPRGAVLIACAIVVPLLWFGPDVIGAGGALGASQGRARHAEPGQRRARRRSRRWRC